MSRVYNFSAGPAVLPEEVLREAQAEMLEYKDSGMSVMEMSHRSKAFQNIIDEAEADFRFLEQFPCKKLLIKGNHDYWWSTVSKMSAFFAEKGYTTFDFLHNNCRFYGEHALCGTRGWFFEEDQKPHNAKVLSREVGRLETSLKAAEGKPIWCFLHYPPLYQGYQCREILEMLEKYSVEQCCYGHLHGPVIRRRIEGERGNTAFSLISADYLGFVPKKICD